MGTQSFAEQHSINDLSSFTSADTTVSKTVTPTRLVDARIDTCLGTNFDSIAHVVNIFVRDPSNVSFFIGSVSIPAGQGTAGTPGVDIFATGLPATVAGVQLPSGYRLELGMAVTITSGAVRFAAQGGTL